MGNTTKHTQIQNSSLLAHVEESLIFLTQWKKPGLLLIYNRYKADFPNKTHLNYLELSKVCAKSLPEIHLILLYEIFASNAYNTVNFLELISVLITYSELSWDCKVKMIFQVFDFDKSKSLTRDEIIIMSKCFYKGIQVATNNRFQLPFVLETSSLQECYFPEIHSSEGIFLPE
jgi:Ca2+-binding EF-hand superfamily protein